MGVLFTKPQNFLEQMQGALVNSYFKVNLPACDSVTVSRPVVNHFMSPLSLSILSGNIRKLLFFLMFPEGKETGQWHEIS